MKYSISLFLIILALLQNSCIMAPAPGNLAAGPGFVTNTKEGFGANNKEQVKKIGKSCITNYAYLVSTGDASVEAAQLNGNIENISSIDKEHNGLGLWIFFLPLFVYQRSCLIVRGN